MNCDEFKQSFYGYLEDQLDARDRERFEAHRDGCQACGALWKLGIELTCRDFVNTMDDYVEDRMLPEQRAIFERHLSVCPDCTSYIESYRRTMKLTRQTLDDPDSKVPDSVPEDLVRAILAARRRQG